MQTAAIGAQRRMASEDVSHDYAHKRQRSDLVLNAGWRLRMSPLAQSTIGTGDSVVLNDGCRRRMFHPAGLSGGGETTSETSIHPHRNVSSNRIAKEPGEVLRR